MKLENKQLDAALNVEVWKVLAQDNFFVKRWGPSASCSQFITTLLRREQKIILPHNHSALL